MNAKGQYIIRKLFQAYATHPQQLPDISIVQFMVETHEKNSLSGGKLSRYGICIQIEFLAKSELILTSSGMVKKAIQIVKTFLSVSA